MVGNHTLANRECHRCSPPPRLPFPPRTCKLTWWAYTRSQFKAMERGVWWGGVVWFGFEALPSHGLSTHLPPWPAQRSASRSKTLCFPIVISSPNQTERHNKCTDIKYSFKELIRDGNGGGGGEIPHDRWTLALEARKQGSDIYPTTHYLVEKVSCFATRMLY